MKTQIYPTPKRLIYHKRAVRTKTNLGKVLILGNAYGIMPYQEPLADALSRRGLNTLWFPFSGQSGSLSGTFSIRSGARDLAQVVDLVQEGHNNTDSPLHILAHCASGLITMEYLRSHPDTPVQKVIVYGLLTDPGRLRDRAEKRLVEAGVCSGLSEWDWTYSAGEVAPVLPVLPFLFCHAEDKLNRRRSTAEELEKLVKRMPDASLKIFPEGYDDNLDAISLYASMYVNWLVAPTDTH
jgi:alpha-beta hydrolase superfamily lysophospholipase